MTPLGTMLYTMFRGEQVGADSFGNKYYRQKSGHPLKKGGGIDSRERRWVIYSGKAEASMVPPEWHGWLHHSTDALPDPNALPRRSWQKEHEPNLTGTARAYHPPGSILAGAHRPRATGDYEPWRPN